MNFWRKIFGFSQREIWHQVALEKGSRFIFGGTMEGDRIEYNVEGNAVAVYITTKGNSWYTVFESYLNIKDSIALDKNYIDGFKKNNMTLTSLENNKEKDSYFLQLKDKGIHKDPELLKRRMAFFATSIETLVKQK